jgi:RHS repeat-associated protein
VALSNIDPGEVSAVKTTDDYTIQVWTVTFQGDLAGSNQPQITVDSTNVEVVSGTLTDIEATDTQGTTNSEVQTITLNNSPTGGTFRLTFGSEQTTDIAYNASAATVDSALEALSGIDTVTVTGSAGGPYTITFTGSHAGTNVAQVTGDATNLTKGTVGRTLSFAYDAASQLSSVDDPAAEYTYTYDNLGRLTAELQEITGLTPDIEFAQTWNANSRRTQLTAEIGGTADFKNDYTYDNLSRLTQIIQQDVSGGNVVADKRVDFAYNALGQYTSIARYQSTGTSNHVATSTYTYDTLNRLTALDHQQGGTDLALYDYTYDFMDRIATMTHDVDGTSTFTYDKESQVTAADHANPRTDESFTFDATGNRTGGSYTNTTNNRTTADATYTYAYDSEGNRSSRTKTSNDYVTEYEWDHRNRLVGVTEKDDMDTLLSTVDYSYDAFNRLVRRTYDDDGPGGNDPTEQFWSYDGGSINPTLDFAGTEDDDLAHRNLWAEAVDQILATEDITSLTSAGNIEWPLADHQGTIRDVADLDEGTGNTSVTNHRTFDAFGILTAQTNSSIEFAFGFMGKPADDATGLIYYVFRWYDPNLGKWPSEDPMTFGAGDTNLSRMVANSVTNLIDPWGLQDAAPGSFPNHSRVFEDVIHLYNGMDVVITIGYQRLGDTLEDRLEDATAHVITRFNQYGGSAPGVMVAELANPEFAKTIDTPTFTPIPHSKIGTIDGLLIPPHYAKEQFEAGNPDYTTTIGLSAKTGSDATASLLLFAMATSAPRAPVPLRAGEAGSFASLNARRITGDALTPHHMPQAALGFTSYGEGGAIVLPHHQHVLTRTYGSAGARLAVEEADVPFRTVFARDIRDIRSIAGKQYNQGLLDLMEYYTTHFPDLISK